MRRYLRTRAGVQVILQDDGRGRGVERALADPPVALAPASRDSASTELRRSSCSTTGTPASRSRARAKASTRGVMSVGEPSSRRGQPITTAASPSSSAASLAISSRIIRRVSASEAGRAITRHGDARIPEASLRARPRRRAP